MVKKIRRVRTFAKTASKSLEKKLVENAKSLKKDPYQILPSYKDKYSNKYFGKIKKNIDKISRFSDDTKKLEKLSNKKSLEGALAGTLLIANSGKAPYLAVTKFQAGEISYAKRGRADKEKLIAVQYFDDPVFRLLGIKDIVLKKNLHVYSWNEGYISTGQSPKPPKEFINYVLKKSNLKISSDTATCNHISKDIAKKGKVCNKNYLRINWNSADIIISICEDCAKSKKNTIFNITKYMLEPDISEDFSIDVVGQVVDKKEIGTERTEHINEYLSGELSDIDFIRKNMRQREESIKESGEKILILDGVSFGDNVEEFVNALNPNKFEKRGLNIILEKIKEPIILNDITPNKVLERFWSEYGKDTLKEIIDDNEMAEKFYKLDGTPSDVLELVLNFKERQKVLSKLPKYKNLPTLANFVDRVVRTYKTFGEKESIAEIKKRPDTPKGKSISYAFLLALGKGKDKKWQYSQVEAEYGEFLKDYAEKLLKAEPKDYHKSLQELLTNSGSSENIDEYLV